MKLVNKLIKWVIYYKAFYVSKFFTFYREGFSCLQNSNFTELEWRTIFSGRRISLLFHSYVKQKIHLIQSSLIQEINVFSFCMLQVINYEVCRIFLWSKLFFLSYGAVGSKKSTVLVTNFLKMKWFQKFTGAWLPKTWFISPLRKTNQISESNGCWTYFQPMWHFLPPEKTRKPMVFWCFQWV